MRLYLSFMFPAVLLIHGGAALLNDRGAGNCSALFDGLRMNRVMAVHGWQGEKVKSRWACAVRDTFGRIST